MLTIALLLFVQGAKDVIALLIRAIGWEFPPFPLYLLAFIFAAGFFSFGAAFDKGFMRKKGQIL